MIPNKNLFIVSSCLIPTIGNVSIDDRISQTRETFLSIRNVPNSLILFADASTSEISIDVLRSFNGLYDFYFDLSKDSEIKNLSVKGMKSHAETLLLLNTVSQFKSNIQLMKILQSVNRIFKISGRYKLTENFDISKYENCFGKYVFKKRIESWLPNNIQINIGSTNLLTTRLFSFCPSLIDNYLNVLINNFQYLNAGLDTEHAHFLNINKNYLKEFEVIGVGGIIASNKEVINE